MQAGSTSCSSRLLVISVTYDRAGPVPADPVRHQISPRQQCRPQRSPTKKTWRWEVGWTARHAAGLRRPCRLGRRSLPPALQPAGRTRCRSTSSASSGCGRSSIPAASARSTSCTCPSARPVRLVMTSQDVIHSFFVPAFRVKQDVVPGRYETLWFHADKPGRYHLFCAEYCGTDHSRMGGWIVVMEPREYADLAARPGRTSRRSRRRAQQLFRRYGCSGCHGAGGTVRAPSLEGPVSAARCRCRTAAS